MCISAYLVTLNILKCTEENNKRLAGNTKTRYLSLDYARHSFIFKFVDIVNVMIPTTQLITFCTADSTTISA